VAHGGLSRAWRHVVLAEVRAERMPQGVKGPRPFSFGMPAAARSTLKFLIRFCNTGDSGSCGGAGGGSRYFYCQQAELGRGGRNGYLRR